MMTVGQERAVREIKRLHMADPDGFEIIGSPTEVNNRLVIVFSIRIGPIALKQGGLNLKEREDFILVIPPDFPFDYPTLKVDHDRFAKFPHVIWSKWVCLYQSKIEWNPSDGLYGFFDRLRMWLQRAASGDMDPIEGPLEPPHHITDFSQVPFVIRSNAPVKAGAHWFGLAELEKHPNRIELIGWNDMTSSWQQGRYPALAIVLREPLPMEFPETGADFFKELIKQGMDRNQILKNLALAALFASEGEPIHLILGIPMRRGLDGSTKLHIAVWTTDSDVAKSLLSILPENSDTESIKSLRQEIADLLYSYFEKVRIKWCRVLEDRSEIVVRRDAGCSIEWFAGKKVLVLGCGALGSWAAEIIARANPNIIHLVDNSIVKPGLLARQNYCLDDIGANKASALAKRLKAILSIGNINHFDHEAHSFIMENTARLSSYDIVVDCTASNIFQMKLERDWNNFGGRTPIIVSMVIDSKAQHCLCVVLDSGSGGGVWDAYVRLKYRLCFNEGSQKEIVSAFYSDQATKNLFQPEPGCSDPTFSGSTADVSSLISAVLNLATKHINDKKPIGIIYSVPDQSRHHELHKVINLLNMTNTEVGNYKIRIDKSIYSEVRSWIRHNNRKRSCDHETGGLLWGLWDDAIGVIWVFGVSGPPPDSQHNPGHFICGISGTVGEHERRVEISHHTCGFIGFWHTHPDMPPSQSVVDLGNMVMLVSKFGQNQKRSLMLIFGRKFKSGTIGIYVYENQDSNSLAETISAHTVEIELEKPVL